MRIRSPQRLVAHALLIGLGISVLVFALSDWSLSDAEAYWNAAHRLRDGEPLYPSVADPEASTVYRYAPWFAALAVPFTFLPVPVAGGIWSAILVVASIAAVVPLGRQGFVVEAFFFGAVLVGISAIGNVQALIVAALVHGLTRQSGPLWIALAASLKVVPLAFALVYLGRRQWWRFGATLVLTLLLVAPMLLFDLSNYVTNPSQAALLIRWPAVWAAAIGIGGLVTLRLAAGRFGWLAAATTAALALPRFFVYDITFLLPGAISATDAKEAEAGARTS